MRKYKPAYGKEVDLDSPKTYKYLPKTYDELRDLMIKEIGYSLLYMNYFPDRKFLFPTKKRKPIYITHPYNNKKFDKNNVGYSQRKRVEKLIKFFAENEDKHRDDLMWLKEQIFLFQDETENMC